MYEKDFQLHIGIAVVKLHERLEQKDTGATQMSSEADGAMHSLTLGAELQAGGFLYIADLYVGLVQNLSGFCQCKMRIPLEKSDAAAFFQTLNMVAQALLRDKGFFRCFGETHFFHCAHEHELIDCHKNLRM